MNRFKFILPVLAFVLCIACFSCIKTSTPPGTSSLNIINAIPLSNGIVTNFLGSNGSKTTDMLQYYSSALQIGYSGSTEISSYTGSVHLSLASVTDTLASEASVTLTMKIGGIYSLFLAGTDSTQVDTVFSTDNIPYYPASGDSLCGVRFVNLSKGSNPVLVTLQSDTTHTPIANNIPYKTITAFQQLAANANALDNGYTFEFRDAATNTILTTVAITDWLPFRPFKSVTVCLIGQPGSSAVVPQTGFIYQNY